MCPSVKVIQVDLSGDETNFSAAAPKNPANLAATAGSNATTVTWERDAGDVDYVVSMTAFDGSNTTAVSGTGVTTSTSVQLGNLRVGFQYSIRVCARNSGGESCSNITFITG